MALDVAVVMDPIGSIKIGKDTSFAMMLEARRRGHRLHYVPPGGLSLDGEQAMGRMAAAEVRDDPAGWYELGPFARRPLAEMDVVLVRTDPPFDANYLYDTHILGLAQARGVLVVNDPQGLRDLNEKLGALLFPQCCPPTRVSRDAADLRAFVAEHGDAVLKPLDGMGGRSIFRVRTGDPNLNVILETLTDNGRNLALAQRYLPGSGTATSASCWSTASRSGRSTACRQRTMPAPTCMPAAAPSIPNSPLANARSVPESALPCARAVSSSSAST
jgi:glutathione synthase